MIVLHDEDIGISKSRRNSVGKMLGESFHSFFRHLFDRRHCSKPLSCVNRPSDSNIVNVLRDRGGEDMAWLVKKDDPRYYRLGRKFPDN